MIVGQTPITEKERMLRLTALAESVATNELEGLKVSPEAAAIFERFVEGELDITQLGSAIDALNEQKFGPLSSPRD
jgi:hypothetical protein